MMAVRNLLSLGRTKPIPVYVWIPPTYGALYKITVTRSDGTIDNITDIIYKGEIIDSVTETIGSFSFEVDNSLENYTSAWKGNEVVRFYSDYATTATTLRFRGRIEKVSYQGNKVKIIGRSESLKLFGVHVNASGTNVETSVIIKALFDAYATDFTYTNMNTSTTVMTVNWYQKPMFECIQEMCHFAEFDFYIDANLDAHYFESGTIKNNTEAVVHGMNLLSVDDFGEDYSQIKNKVGVEGGDIEGLPLLSFAKSTDANYGINSALGVRELIIKDQNIITQTQAKERADSELAFALNPNTIGEAICMGLATIQPGEQIKISAPASNLPPADYTIISYKHQFEGFMKTTLVINKEATKLQKILRDRISNEKEVNIKNQYAMEYSWNFDFLTDSGTHLSTVITGGVLKTDGGASGVWESDILEVSENIIGVELRINGSSLVGTKVYLSTNGGVAYTQIYGTGSGLASLASGKKLRIRVNLASANTQISSLALLYK